jgi:transcriptional regulator with XRE-family HTH domain
MKLSERLLFLRKSLKKNQIPFAKELGVSQAAYQNYERGLTDTPLSLIRTICDEYKISINWLVYGEGSMESDNTMELVEEAAFTIRDFITKCDFIITPQKEASLVAYLFEGMAEGKKYSIDELKKLYRLME